MPSFVMMALVAGGTWKEQGPAGQRWVIGHIKQIQHIKEFQHIEHINRSRKVKKLLTRFSPQMSSSQK